MVNDLVRRAQAGDAVAFHALVEHFNSAAGRTARVLLPDRMAAEDAVQEAWLDAWKNLSRFELGRPFRPWLLTLVANRCRMTRRRRGARTVTLEDVSLEILSDGTDVQRDVMRSLMDEELLIALQTLPANQRQVVALYYFANLEIAEIASVLNTRVGTIKSRLHRARSTLRRCLERGPMEPSLTQMPMPKEQSI